MKITYRKPTANDKAWMREAHHLGYRDVVIAQFGNWDLQRQDEFFEKKWSHANLEILVADGVDCGWVTVEENADEIRLIELVIHPEQQGQGVGTEFLLQLSDRAKASRVPLTMQVLLNNRAIELYRRLGFSECGRTETHVEMERKNFFKH